MKLYGIRYAKGFRYGTMETVLRTQKGNHELIADFSFFYYLAETEGKHFLIDTGFRDRRVAAEMGVSLLPIEKEIMQVFGSFPEIDAIFLTHSHWDHINNIDLYPNARLIMSRLTYENAVSEGTSEVIDRLLETKARISLVEERECFYDRFHFEVIGGHTLDSSVLYFQMGNDTYCITGDECYFCDNMDKDIPIGISVCGEKNERFIRKAHERGWIPLPFHDAGILKRYDRLTENIVRMC
jgi:glyoxylase-like metal-dependent hydrolase (beta-lactamase superfamily II)